MQIRNRGDAALAALLFFGSVFLFCQTWQIREIFSYSFGPRVFPRIILGLTALLSACLFAQSLGPGASPGPVLDRGAAHSRKQAETGPDVREAARLRAGLILLLLAYILALPYAGYAGATMPFLFAGMAFLGRRHVKAVALYAVLSVGMTLLLKFIFGTLLKFFLP